MNLSRKLLKSMVSPNILDDALTLSYEELCALFDPTINNIIALIDEQLEQAPDIAVIFMVGGFATV